MQIFQNKRNHLVLKVILLLTAISFQSFSAAKTWIGTTTEWADPNNWSTTGVPTISDDVTIPTSPTGGNFPIISTGIAAVKDFTIQSGATVTQTGGTLQVDNEWENSGTFTASAGTVQFTSDGGGASFFDVGTNQFYNLIVDAGVDPKFDNNTNSVILIANDFTNNNTGLDVNSRPTFIFNGTGTQYIYSAAISGKQTFGYLEINKSSGSAILTSTIDVFSDLTVTSGTFSTGSDYSLIIGGNAVFNGGSFNMNASAIDVTGNWTNAGCTITGGASTITVPGDMTLTGGSLSAGTASLALAGNFSNSSGGTFAMSSVTFSGAAKSIGGTSTTTFSAINITRGTITLNADASSTGLTFNNNNVANSLTIASGKTLTINGDLIINQASGGGVAHSLNVNSGTAVINGNVSFNVTTSNGGRVARIATTTGTITVTGNITMTNTLLAANSIIDMSGGAGTLNLGGNLTVTTLGTLTPGTTSTVNFNGSSAQSIDYSSQLRYNNININNTAGVTTNAAITSALVTGNLRVQSGTFTNSGFAVAGAAAKAFEVANGATFRLTSTTGMVTGFGTKTFGATSTVDYNGAAQTISAETYGHLTLSNSGVKTMPGSTMTLAGNFTMSGTATTTAAQALATNGNFTVGAGTTFSASSFSHDIKGNWTNDGTMNRNTSTFTFNGGGAQTINGANVTTFNNLTINNSNGVTLNQDANVSTLLTMTSGKLISTTTNILTLESAANANIGSSTAYVDGPMIQTVATASPVSKTFPVGKGAAYRPVVLNVDHSDATSVTYQADVSNSSAAALGNSLPGGLEKVSPTRYTSIARQAVANFTNATIQIYYAADDGVTDFNNLRLVNDDGAGNWVNIGGTGTANGSGNINSASFTAFNTNFALANATGGTNPLPIKLSYFSAKPTDKKVSINWGTFSENNNDKFEIQRASATFNFQTIATVEGAGNSNTPLEYNIDDQDPIKGISYYRLVQIDYNGKSEIFEPVKVLFESKSTFKVYPTVSNGKEIHLHHDDSDLATYNISIKSIDGNEIPIVKTLINGDMVISIENNNVNSNGVYFITCENGKNIYHSKIIIL